MESLAKPTTAFSIDQNVILVIEEVCDKENSSNSDGAPNNVSATEAVAEAAGELSGALVINAAFAFEVSKLSIHSSIDNANPYFENKCFIYLP